jgi:hypothetical protein
MGIFSPILFAIQFTNLFIFCNQFSLRILVRNIDFLPNLDVLKVSYSSLEEFSRLSAEETEDFHLASINNKMTKVWQRSRFELTEFLIHFCPRMEHLTISWIVDKDVNTHIRYLLVCIMSMTK